MFLIIFFVNAIIVQAFCATIEARPNASTNYDQRQSGKYNIHVNIKDVSIIAVEADELVGAVGDTGGSTYEDYYEYDTGDFTISPLISLLGSLANRTSTTSTTTSPTTRRPAEENLNLNSTTVKPSQLVSTNTQASAQKPCTPIKNPEIVDPDEEIPITTEKSTIENDPKNVTEDSISTNVSFDNEPSLQENEIPVHVVMEPVLIPKQRTSTTTTTSATPQIHQSNRRPSIEILNKAVKQNFKLRNEGHNRKCTSGQYRDRLGRCRNRRTGVRRLLDILSLLKPNV